MKKKKSTPADAAELRRRAEERMKSRGSEVAGPAAAPEETQRLVQELQVHQIELELQNEELLGARAELEAGLERYANLYDFAPAAYVTLDCDGVIQKANLAGARLLGTERARLVGKHFGYLVSAEGRSIFTAFLEQVFEGQGQEVCEVELTIEPSDPRAPEKKASLWVHIEATASEDSGEECRAVLVDITGRRRMEETVRFRMTLLDYATTHSLEQLLHKTLDAIGALTNSPMGFYHFVESDQKTLSPQASFGRNWEARSEAQGRDDSFDWIDCVRDRQPIIRNGGGALPRRSGLLEGRAAVARELIVPVVRSDRVMAVVGVGNKATDYTESDVEIVSYLADIAWTIIERKRAEEALREADRNKTQFLAVLSHELRNPLAPITNSLYILDRVVPGGGQARRAQAVIARQVAQLSRLVDDLLDMTRISRDKLRLQQERLELNELVRRTMEDHRAQFEKSGVRLELVPASEPVFVMGDWNRLAQVVGNLLQNAAKFAGRDGQTSVSVSTDTVARRGVVRVADTGVGMDEKTLARLFRPFEQADTAPDINKGGLGLGLALVKGLVELHGGEVQAHSAGLGQGAEFVVSLPLALEEAAADRGAPRGPVSSRRVLIIEDNVDAADSLRDALELSAHRVVVAYDGAQGLAKAREFHPEVVLCDLELPGMDGYGVARAFRAEDLLKGMYLVALSGHVLPEDLEKASAAGFDRHLAKPLSLERLEEMLGAVRAQGPAPGPAPGPNGP